MITPCDANAGPKSVMWHQHRHKWCHMTKDSHATPCFYHLILTNVVVPLTMPLASWDADIGTNGIIWPLSPVVPHFDCPDLTNAIVLLVILAASHDVTANAVTKPIQPCCTLFWSSWPNTCDGTIDNNVSIIWCWHSHQWCHMIKKVMMNLISITLI